MRLQKIVSGLAVVIAALSVGACGGQSGLIPGSDVRGPTFATQAVVSRPLSLHAGAVPAQTQETVLHSFGGGNGSGVSPTAGLTNVNGVLYGTTEGGGANNCSSGSGLGCGNVFKITTSGTARVLYRFANPSVGERPYAGLTDVNGVLYGTTEDGGANGNNGTVFKITTSGSESLLYSFAGGSDGQSPEAGLTNVNGVLYGTTAGGGANSRGTVFKITTSGAESVLYSFAGGSDGASPYAATGRHSTGVSTALMEPDWVAGPSSK